MAKLTLALLLVATSTIWISTEAAPLVNGLLHVLDDADIATLLSSCKSKSGGCGGQDDRAKRTRAAVKLSLTRDLGDGHSKGMSDEQAENLLQGTQTIKTALMLVNKLTGVVAYDNGLLGGDRVLKSQSEIDTLLGRIKGTLPPVVANLLDPITPNGGVGGGGGHIGDVLGRRKKRADALSLDYYRGNRWPSNTINVYIDPKIFNASQAATIRDGLKSITSQVPCLKFVEKNQEPFVDFVKTPKNTDAGTCGWSSVGYQKGQRNDVNLNFDSSICRPAMKGVVVHEFLHALGFSHEHTRNDRDTYMKINWNNVDAQSVDVFDKDDPSDYNPYGKSYDELSIMHYDVYVGAANSNKPSMSSIKHPDWASKIGNGQRMTDTDAALLKRLYCSATNCRDAGPNCGWRAVAGECSKIKSSCPKSCGACDTSSSG